MMLKRRCKGKSCVLEKLLRNFSDYSQNLLSLPSVSLLTPLFVTMKQQTIYELAIIPTGSLNSIRSKEPHFVFFSNLKKTLENLAAALALNGWPQKINYSAVYRSLKDRGKYFIEFDVAGNKVFRVVITPKILNPVLPTLGIEEMPLVKKR